MRITPLLAHPFIRTARAAGRKPPANPIIKANSSDLRIIATLSLKLKASSAKVCQFMVEMDRNCMSEAKPSPIIPPIIPRNNDSSRKVRRMFCLRKRRDIQGITGEQTSLEF